MRVGSADDHYERAAHQAARLTTAGSAASGPIPVRRAAGPGPGGVVLPEIQRSIASEARLGGRPIPTAVRAPLEQSLGAEFGGVRVHTGGRADGLARSLQARAFTTGQDIFFRRGEYHPSTPSGQHVLAHELTHVVQQSAAAAPGAGLVQRLVGFEFETDWGAHGIADPAQRAPKGHRLRKHKVYKKGLRFTVQVDEASREFKPEYPSLGSQIEFVVNPHPETLDGGRKLLKTMRALKAEAEMLEGLRARLGPNDVSFKYPGTNIDIWVFPNAKTTAQPTIHARPQATVGLALWAISEYGLRAAGEFDRTRSTGFIVSHANRDIALGGLKNPFIASATAAERIPGASEALQGLVTLLSFYINIFHDPGTKKADYVKGYLPMLAKTDFAEMFRQLPYGVDKTLYQLDPRAFVDLVLQNASAAGQVALAPDAPVIPQRLLKNEDRLLHLSLHKWLMQIPKGTDLLTSETDSRLFGLADLGKGAKKGRMTDDPSGEGERRIIIEFRAGSRGRGPGGIKGFLTPAEWLEFAFDYYSMVRMAHDRQVADEWPEFKPKQPAAKKPKPKAKGKGTAKARRNSALI
jgi:hypothetical protein